jgi:hypothetical protein
MIGDVDWAFATDRLTDGSKGMLWAEEQRAIGELMVTTRDDGSSICQGYAAFSDEYKIRFEPRMRSLASHVLAKSALCSYRLRLVQWALTGLVAQLDEEHVHSDAKWMAVAGSELQEPEFDPILNPEILPRAAQRSVSLERPRVEERIRADLARVLVPDVPPVR